MTRREIYAETFEFKMTKTQKLFLEKKASEKSATMPVAQVLRNMIDQAMHFDALKKDGFNGKLQGVRKSN